MRYIALWRGINVGKAKRLAMADLKALLAELGATDVATLLNSGNAVFDAPKTLRSPSLCRPTQGRRTAPPRPTAAPMSWTRARPRGDWTRH